MRQYLIIVIALLACSCSEIEESTHITDSHVYYELIIELNKSNINYRRGKDLSVFYPISESNKVKAIKENVISKYYTSCGVSLLKPAMYESLKYELLNKNIPFREVTTDDGLKLACPNEYQNEFSMLLKSVLNNHVNK